MIKKVKAVVRKFLKEKYDKEYERELLHHTMDYHEWITLREAEAKDDCREHSQIVSKSWSFSALQELEKFVNILEKEDSDVILLASSIHDIRPGAREKIEKEFANNESIQLLYTDEDEIEAGRRKNPWFKPDFSPETLLSYFYFGNFIALRKRFFISAYGHVLNERGIKKEDDLKKMSPVMDKDASWLLSDNNNDNLLKNKSFS